MSPPGDDVSFVFPGMGAAADDVFVTRARADSPQAGFVRMHPTIAARLLHGWALRADSARLLERLSLAVLGKPLGLRGAATGLSRVLTPLAELVENERLHVWAPKRIAVERPAQFPLGFPADRPKEPVASAETATWKLVEFALETADGVATAALAPDAEDPSTRFGWRLDDPDDQVTVGRIELFADRNAPMPSPNPFSTIHMNLGRLQAWKFDWQGHVGASPDFPLGFTTCEHSPYRARLTVEGRVGAPQSLSCDFAVEAVRLDLEVGPRNLVSHPRHLEVYDQLFGAEHLGDDDIRPLPAVRTVNVELRTAGYAASDDEMTTRDRDPSYDEWLREWGPGIEIPLLASVFFRSSSGKAVLAEKAWGHRRVLFDWIEAPEDTSNLSPKVKTFVDKARAYKTAEPRPDSTLCHADRGGRRSPEPAPFRDDGWFKGTPRPDGSIGTPTTPMGFGFFSTNSRSPFDIAHAPFRPGAVLSGAQHAGDLQGRAGTLLCLPRQAGETLSVIAAFDSRATPAERPGKGFQPANSEFHQTTPFFRTQRVVEIVRHILKNREMLGQQTAFMDAQQFFDPAFLVLKNKVKEIEFLVDLGDYDAEIRKAIDSLTYADVAMIIPPIPGKAAPSPAAPAPVSADPKYSDFLIREHLFNLKEEQAKGTAAAVMWTNDELLDQFGEYVGQKLAAEIQVTRLWPRLGGKTGAGIHRQLATRCVEIVSNRVFRKLAGNRDGIQLLEYVSFAPTSLGLTERGCSFADDREAGRILLAGGEHPAVARFFSHEAGHELFLRHARGSVAPDLEAHDPLDQLACVMSSETLPDKHFCGVCVLRLRGWRAPL